MPVARTSKLAPNFTAGELGADHPDANDRVVANLRLVAGWLQTFRDLINLDVPAGGPQRRIIITSGFRPKTDNEAVGGSATSDHPEGLAADFIVNNLSAHDVYLRITAAQKRGELPEFDQLIWYVADNHVHLGLGMRRRGQLLLKTAEGSFVQLAGELVQKLRGFV